MPIVLDLWDGTPKVAAAPWTTVMTWNAFKGKLTCNGVEYKSKSAEFESIIDLPRRSGLKTKVAVGGVNAPIERLTAAGRDAIDGPAVTLSPESYQKFIAGSRGEKRICETAQWLVQRP